MAPDQNAPDSSRGDVDAGAFRQDLFISYAHADNQPPTDDRAGWVTTLANNLGKMLRMKLGPTDTRIWLDHRLEGQKSIDQSLLEQLRSSRTLLLVMSPAYVQSEWCRRELASFLEASSSYESKGNVFIVEAHPTDHESWPPALRGLLPLRFWEQTYKSQAPRLLGYPYPESDEKAYWHNLNELAYLIAKYLKPKDERAPVAPKPAVLLAETTDDMVYLRHRIAVWLHERGYETLPADDLPRSSETEFLRALRDDLGRAAVFVQLLGAHPGNGAFGGEHSFVALQAAEAERAHAESGLPLLLWRSRDIDLATVTDTAYRSLLQGRHVRASPMEEFKHAVLAALAPKSEPPGREREPQSEHALLLYVIADAIDRELASQISKLLTILGADVLLSTAREPDQSATEFRRLQEEHLNSSDGVVLVYGKTSPTWLQAQYVLAKKVMAKRHTGVWGAVLDGPPQQKPGHGLHSRNLMVLDCRRGMDPDPIDRFIGTLRQVVRRAAGQGRGSATATDIQLLLDELSHPQTTHQRRAEIGDALDQLSDPRPGVGLRPDGVPELVWLPVPGGQVLLERVGKPFEVEPFRVAKHPVTYRQYRAFLDDPEGYRNPAWWTDLRREEKPGEPRWPVGNRPAERVSWYDAMAYARWLSARLGYEVRLPTEWEWQHAATGGEPDQEYPWGQEWDAARANTYECELGQTTAVGMYPQGASRVGALDLAGNVWEWGLNEYDKPERQVGKGNARRVVRGGSWHDDRVLARSAYRGADSPGYRNDGLGLRLVCVAPIA